MKFCQFCLRNGDRFRIKTGFNSFDQHKFESITNIPGQVGRQGKIDQVTVDVAGGVNLFDNLPTDLNFHAKVEAPIGLKVSSSGHFSAAANLFNWSYSIEREKKSGYFAPANFLIYNGEVGWERNVFEKFVVDGRLLWDNSDLSETLITPTRLPS